MRLSPVALLLLLFSCSTAQVTNSECRHKGECRDGQVCDNGKCVECTTVVDCVSPPGEPDCFSKSCQSNACVYQVANPTQVCRGAKCVDGVISFERVCGTDGLCVSTGEESCQGYACVSTSPPICGTTCASHNSCAPGFYCVGDACVAGAANSEACNPILAGHDCQSGHCQNGDCCIEGDCCATAADCAPLARPAACMSQSDCRGGAEIATCDSNQ